MRCIEIWLNVKKLYALNDKLQHEMYWNASNNWYTLNFLPINYNMRCIEIRYEEQQTYYTHKINYNMRCIEILLLCFNFFHLSDKLQHEMYWNIYYLILHLAQDDDKLQHEMYWNFISINDVKNSLSDKLQHEMYWNSENIIPFCKIYSDKLQHEMYWNFARPLAAYSPLLINYNMRCIEIPFL